MSIFKFDYDLTLTALGDGKITLSDRLWVKVCIARSLVRLMFTDVAKLPTERVPVPTFDPSPSGAVYIGDIKTLGAPTAGDDCTCMGCTMRRAMAAAVGKVSKPDKSKLH